MGVGVGIGAGGEGAGEGGEEWGGVGWGGGGGTRLREGKERGGIEEREMTEEDGKGRKQDKEKE